MPKRHLFRLKNYNSRKTDAFVAMNIFLDVKITLCLETFGVSIANHALVYVIAPDVLVQIQTTYVGLNNFGKASLSRLHLFCLHMQYCEQSVRKTGRHIKKSSTTITNKIQKQQISTQNIRRCATALADRGLKNTYIERCPQRPCL